MAVGRDTDGEVDGRGGRITCTVGRRGQRDRRQQAEDPDASSRADINLAVGNRRRNELISVAEVVATIGG